MVRIGSRYPTNNNGDIVVLNKSPRSDYYGVQFVDTGTVIETRGYQIKNGCVRDPYAKSVRGVAYTGQIKTKGKYKQYYSVWHDMIERCYNPENKRHNAYESVSVDPAWLSFETFYHDAKDVDGFDEHLFCQGSLVLDKDIKQRRVKDKVYSKSTCTWVDKHTNNTIQDSQQKPFVAISPSGSVFHDFNISRFAKEHGLDRKHISAILHGRGKTTSGWKFSYEEIV